MTTYLINYYSNTFKVNHKLEKCIKELSDQCIGVFPNTWFITTSEIAVHISAFLAEAIEKDDQILVTATNGECSSLGLKNNTIEFLNSYC
ncbi:hypothetical protein ASG22_08475 [Chryseobacterium sp. Leaf405]|uniref:hypothetical protein n=1 Tax=Chryseobacterium sp. Leaf405 TaxID=1736367 RepID=UPI0006FCEBBF|nr:hypothetical protein [Chryseobacterium sp. Leaf405]KQT24046.1 hypothetical protein ASG22_08475 [Chryseobacterium sp. Leaf405]